MKLMDLKDMSYKLLITQSSSISVKSMLSQPGSN